MRGSAETLDGSINQYICISFPCKRDSEEILDCSWEGRSSQYLDWNSCFPTGEVDLFRNFSLEQIPSACQDIYQQSSQENRDSTQESAEVPSLAEVARPQQDQHESAGASRDTVSSLLCLSTKWRSEKQETKSVAKLAPLPQPSTVQESSLYSLQTSRAPPWVSPQQNATGVCISSLTNQLKSKEATRSRQNTTRRFLVIKSQQSIFKE